ncbi:MAG: OmpA family protein [Myxococcota bacterium]|nr:OmpA family protein [Myxococcota bacterium]
MSDEWIQGRFVGVYTGSRLARESGDPSGARRFSFEIRSGSVRDFELVPEPLETDPPGEPKEIRQVRIERVALPLLDGAAASERPLFDVRLRDWRLRHPAESRGRSFGTIEGTIQARLTPPPVRERAAGPAPQRERAGAAAASGVPETHAGVVYARLRWTLALLVLGAVTFAFALACGGAAATLWGAPVGLALLLRRLTRRLAFGPAALHAWLGVAILLGQGVWHAEPVLAWWRAGCGAAALASLPWLAAPVVAAGLVRARWAPVLSAAGWAVVVCASCWPLAGGCAAPAEAAAPAPPPAHAPRPRTGPDGRWPVMPSGAAVAPGAPRAAGIAPLASGGATAGGASAPAGAPGAPDGTALSGLAGAVGSAGLAAGESAGPETPPAVPSGRPAQQSLPPASARPASRVPQSLRGGWVAADHARAARELVRISVEHANRRPEAFFGPAAGSRRVYLPTDPIFDAGGDQILPAGQVELSRLANLLSLHPERPAVLEVHTDAAGDPRAQLDLSVRRALAVHEWLLDRGHLAPGQLQVRGLGGTRPLVPPDGSFAAQQPNRRLEAWLVGPGSILGGEEGRP